MHGTLHRRGYRGHGARSFLSFSAVLFLCVLCVFRGGEVSLAAAVSDYIGKPVASVRFVLEGREVNEPTFSELVETAVGQPLSMVEVRESIAQLFSLGRFEDVAVDASLESGRVALRYVLTPVH